MVILVKKVTFVQFLFLFLFVVFVVIFLFKFIYCFGFRFCLNTLMKRTKHKQKHDLHSSTTSITANGKFGSTVHVHFIACFIAHPTATTRYVLPVNEQLFVS